MTYLIPELLQYQIMQGPMVLHAKQQKIILDIIGHVQLIIHIMNTQQQLAIGVILVLQVSQLKQTVFAHA